MWFKPVLQFVEQNDSGLGCNFTLKRGDQHTHRPYTQPGKWYPHAVMYRDRASNKGYSPNI
mgnify:CR=1 FL=1